MRILLDTHVLIWAFGRERRLSAEASAALAAPDNGVYVSAASIWEISIKQAMGRLDFPLTHVDERMAALQFEALMITHAHAVAAGSLPPHHNDPFDRMLIAQAQLEGLTLMTQDAAIGRYDVRIFGRS